MGQDREPDETEVKTEMAVGLAKWLPVELSLRHGVTRRYKARVQDALDQVDAPPDLIEQRLEESEGLDAALTAAVAAAVASGLSEKRRLLGMLINRAVLDDAQVDHTTLMVGILGQIDAPHVRALEAIRRAEVEVQEAGEVAPRAEGAEREMNEHRSSRSRATAAGPGRSGEPGTAGERQHLGRERVRQGPDPLR
jgi:hypothetical protein